MAQLFFAGEAWSTVELKSDAVIVTLIVVAIVGYIAAANGSYVYKKRTTRQRKPVLFKQVFQADIATRNVKVCGSTKLV